jgi:hypothetical protein
VVVFAGLLRSTWMRRGPADYEIGLPDYFTNAAERTYAAYGAAIRAGTEEKPAADAPVMPSKYWTEPIKALRPIRVYLHQESKIYG